MAAITVSRLSPISPKPLRISPILSSTSRGEAAQVIFLPVVAGDPVGLFGDGDGDLSQNGTPRERRRSDRRCVERGPAAADRRCTERTEPMARSMRRASSSVVVSSRLPRDRAPSSSTASRARSSCIRASSVSSMALDRSASARRAAAASSTLRRRAQTRDGASIVGAMERSTSLRHGAAFSDRRLLDRQDVSEREAAETAFQVVDLKRLQPKSSIWSNST